MLRYLRNGLVIGGIVLALILFGYPLASTGQHGFDTEVWPQGAVRWRQWYDYVTTFNISEILDHYANMLRNSSNEFAWGGRVVLGLTASPFAIAAIWLIKGKKFGLARDLSGVFGASRWANAAELGLMKSGLELGTDKLTGRAVRVSIEGNLLTIAAPRKGKSAGLLIPNLVCPELEAWAGPAVVIDPKGAVFLSVAKRRREIGRTVRCIDPVNLVGGTDCWNPFKQLDPNDILYLQLTAQALLPESVGATDSSGYFRSRAVDLLVGAMLVAHQSDEPSLSEVLRLLNSPDDFVEGLNKLASEPAAKIALEIMMDDPWQAARDFVPGHEVDQIVERDLDPPEIEGTGPVAVAASKLFRHQSVISRKELLLGALVEASFSAVSVDQVWAEIQSYEQRGILIKLAGEERAECWTTPSIAASEARLLRAADRSDERDWFRQDAVEAALADAPHLSEEQAHAIRFSANRDGVAICEAPAGTGKTVMARALVEAAQRSGLKILGLSPTWVAADELSKSCGIEAQAIAKWRYAQQRGLNAAIDATTLIVIDEVGVAGVRELESVLSVAHEAHAKVVCFGDRRQLEAVQGGSALRAVVDVVARGAVLSQVRRQEVAWQRAASKVMAKGDSEAGLRAYASNGKLKLISGEAEAQACVIHAWNDLRQAHGDDVLIVTRRNVDAAALNKAARSVLRTEGRLLGRDLSLPAVGRDRKIGAIELAQGDRIRFGENLPQFCIRNGTRGTIEHIISDVSVVHLAVRLDDGRLIEAPWASLVREQPGRLPLPPRIVSAYAGTAYSVQGRTSAAAVLYIAKPTDARESASPRRLSSRCFSSSGVSDSTLSGFIWKPSVSLALLSASLRPASSFAAACLLWKRLISSAMADTSSRIFLFIASTTYPFSRTPCLLAATPNASSRIPGKSI
jgi:hypothetical protein